MLVVDASCACVCDVLIDSPGAEGIRERLADGDHTARASAPVAFLLDELRGALLAAAREEPASTNAWDGHI